MSMDESVSVELSKIKTVKHMPISTNCIAKKKDFENWPHLCDMELTTVRRWWCRVGDWAEREAEFVLTNRVLCWSGWGPVADRCSLRWIVIGPVGGGSYTADCSATLLCLMENSVYCDSGLHLQDCVSFDGSRADIAFPEGTDNEAFLGHHTFEHYFSMEFALYKYIIITIIES